MKAKYLISLIGSILLTQILQAQGFQRKGFAFGTSLGAANTRLKFPNKSETHTDLSLDLKVGYMLNSNMAVALTSNISIYNYSGFGRDRKRDFGVLAPSFQYWLNDKFWMMAGVGIGGDNPVFWDVKNPSIDSLETKYYTGLGFVTAAGYEFYKIKNTVFDIKAKFTFRNVEMQEGKTSGTSFGILLGINFY